MVDSELLTLRLLHIGGGAFWVGSAVFIAGFVEPVARSLGPDGGRFMQGLVKERRLPLYMEIATFLTLASGLMLFWRDSAGLEWAWIRTGTGLSFSIGGFAAVLAALLGNLVNAPTAKKVAALGRELSSSAGPPRGAQLAEMNALQARMRLATRMSAALLVIALLGMAVARYLYL